MAAIMVTDVGLLYAAAVSDPKGFSIGGVSRWGMGEWGNYGILGVLVALRSAFLLGVGGVGTDV